MLIFHKMCPICWWCLLCVVCITYTSPVSPFRGKRHGADLKLSQYLVCSSTIGPYIPGCRNIGWGLVDIHLSGKKKRKNRGPLGNKKRSSRPSIVQSVNKGEMVD